MKKKRLKNDSIQKHTINLDYLNNKYGEFVCSQFNWVDPDYQKENAKRLSDITKQDK